MPMALCSSPPLGIRLLAIFLAFATSTRATTNGNPPASAPAPVPAAAAADRRLLWTCCANTTNASVCYDSLLPFAGSFHGNRVRVARAAAFLAIERLSGFHDELRHLLLQPGGSGAGRSLDRSLRYCATSAEDILGDEWKALAALRRLETAAGRRRGEQEWDLHNANLFVGGVGSCGTLCVDDLTSTGDEVLATPVGKKVLAWVANVRSYGDVALDLVASRKL
ncbi:unnamed protein product [Urochloa humidicola]